MSYITRVMHRGAVKFVEQEIQGKIIRLTVRPDAALSCEEMTNAKAIRDCALHPDYGYSKVSLVYTN